MSEQKVVILDGSRAGDEVAATALRTLTDLYEARGTDVQVFSLQGLKLGHCIGCFGCWLKTPGVCVHDDAGREIASAMMGSDTTVLLGRVEFGGYSPELKRMVDRFLPLILPYFGVYHGETHHMPRYSRYPRIVAAGLQRERNAEEADLFKVLVGRNAMNFHAPSHAAEVVADSDSPSEVRAGFERLLTAEDAWPLDPELAALLPAPDPISDVSGRDGVSRALLIVGSPKVKESSTSAVLGGRVRDGLAQRGWETETLKLKAGLRQDAGRAELLSAADRADLLILAFPLYIDSPPILVGEALRTIAENRRTQPEPRRQRLAVIVNNGFPEAFQNNAAVAICRQFAVQNGIAWAGALAMGAGEAISSGAPLAEASPSGLPTGHAVRALDEAAASLAEGQPVSVQAATGIAAVPIPGMPFEAWRGMFIQTAGQHWEQGVAANGLEPGQILDRPYENGPCAPLR